MSFIVGIVAPAKAVGGCCPIQCVCLCPRWKVSETIRGKLYDSTRGSANLLKSNKFVSQAFELEKLYSQLITKEGLCLAIFLNVKCGGAKKEPSSFNYVHHPGSSKHFCSLR